MPFSTSANTPEISIAGPTIAVNEGEEATFTIMASQQTNVDLTIPVAITDLASRTNTDFVDEETIYVRLENGTTSKSFNIATNEDEVDEIDGVISATVQTDSNYTISTRAGTAYADVLDNDDVVPPVVVSVAALPAPILEGESTTFTITRAGIDFTQPLTVSYELTQREIASDTTSGVFETTIDAFSANKTITINTTANTNNTLTHQAGITLRLRSAREYHTAAYRVDEDAGSFLVRVTDFTQPVFLD